MICEDCIYELGIEEYEYHRPSRKTRYRCSRCDEIVPIPSGGANIENNIIYAMEHKEKKIRKHLPISFVILKRNCKHNKKRLYPCGGTCFYNQKKHKKYRKKKFYADICDITECPLLESS